MRLTPAIIAATHQLFLRFTRVYKYTGYIIKLNPKVRFDILVKWYIGGGGASLGILVKILHFFANFFAKRCEKPCLNSLLALFPVLAFKSYIQFEDFARLRYQRF